MSEKKVLYKVQFIHQGEQYEVYVRSLTTSSLFGFIEISEFVWNTHSSLVLDTSEEKLKSEFENVERTYLPMHNILRIDQVQKQGTAKITTLSDKVSHINRPVYTPGPKN